MNKKFINFLIDVLRPLALVIGFVVRGVYFVLVGWWYERRFRTKQQTALIGEIRELFWFLFSQQNGEIVPNGDVGHLAVLGASIVTVRVDGLLFRFIRWRDNRQVHVGHVRIPGAWYELSSILSVMLPDKVQRRSIAFFEDAARLLHENFDVVRDAFSEDRYPLVKERIDDADKYDRNVTKQVEVAINRALYK